MVAYLYIRSFTEYD